MLHLICQLPLSVRFRDCCHGTSQTLTLCKECSRYHQLQIDEGGASESSVHPFSSMRWYLILFSAIFLHPVQLGLIISPQSDRLVMLLPQLVRRIISEDETLKVTISFIAVVFTSRGLFPFLFHFSSVCPLLFRDSGGPQLLGGGANLQSNRKTVGGTQWGGFDCS